MAIMKHHDQKLLREKKFCLEHAYTVLLIIYESETRNLKIAGTLRQELLQRPWWGASSWLVPYRLFCLLSYTMQKYDPRVATYISVGLVISHQLLTKKNPSMLAYRPVSQKHFLNYGSLL